MWACARKTMFCMVAATSGLNKVGGIMIKAYDKINKFIDYFNETMAKPFR